MHEQTTDKLYMPSWLSFINTVESWFLKYTASFLNLPTDNSNQKSLLSSFKLCNFLPISRTLQFFESIQVSFPLEVRKIGIPPYEQHSAVSWLAALLTTYSVVDGE